MYFHNTYRFYQDTGAQSKCQGTVTQGLAEQKITGGEHGSSKLTAGNSDSAKIQGAVRFPRYWLDQQWREQGQPSRPPLHSKSREKHCPRPPLRLVGRNSSCDFRTPGELPRQHFLLRPAAARLRHSLWQPRSGKGLHSLHALPSSTARPDCQSHLSHVPEEPKEMLGETCPKRDRRRRRRGACLLCNSKGSNLGKKQVLQSHQLMLLQLLQKIVPGSE
ncbi:hypothetical protein NDU88_001202 [Pleurodeles waltl]|uniref:Uncharacterized protein n=1 Tax=Pleurodeles waltl TaxID=8319 RepID=A0AAV7VYG8_PLEWA|nr:hypothetical protein NDU88_001202 [Pleurodeles waltl]